MSFCQEEGMPHDIDLILTLTAGLVAALILGLAARRLSLSRLTLMLKLRENLRSGRE